MTDSAEFSRVPYIGKIQTKEQMEVNRLFRCASFGFQISFKILDFVFFFIAIYDHLSSDSAFVSYRVDLALIRATHQQCCRGWFVLFSKLFPKFAL